MVTVINVEEETGELKTDISLGWQNLNVNTPFND